VEEASMARVAQPATVRTTRGDVPRASCTGWEASRRRVQDETCRREMGGTASTTHTLWADRAQRELHTRRLVRACGPGQ